MNNRYSWKIMPGYYNYGIYSFNDYYKGRPFTVIDNINNKEYILSKNDYYIDKDLYNREFFVWACNTAPDFCSYVPEQFITEELIDICLEKATNPAFILKVPNLTKEQAHLFVKRLPRAIQFINPEYRTRDLVDIVAKCDPNLLINFDSSYIDKDLALKCYKLVNNNMRTEFVKKKLMNNILTSEMLLELIKTNYPFNGTIDKYINEQFWSNIDINIITKEIAYIMFNKSYNYIKYIPDKYLTYEMKKDAIIYNPYNIKYISNDKNLAMYALKQDYKVFELIEKEIIDNELINYAVEQDGLVIKYLEKEKLTSQLCNKAFFSNYKAYEFIPKEYKSIYLSLEVLKRDSSYIKYIPVEYLTNGFKKEIKSQQINLDLESIDYLYAAVRINERKDNYINNNELNNIDLSCLSCYFNKNVLKKLSNIGITNFKELFMYVDSIDNLKYFYEDVNYSEISNTVNLLKCKYLDIDPLIDINSEEIDSSLLYRLLGLSSRTKNCLYRYNFSKNSKEFFDMYALIDEDPIFLEKLKSMRNIGAWSSREITQKTSIVYNFYSNKEIEYVDKSRKEILEKYKKDLIELKEKRMIIDSQIVSLSNQIIELEESINTSEVKRILKK